MAFVSVTRLRLRRFWFLPAFAWRSRQSAREAERTPGFLSGAVYGDPPRLTFWTITLWRDEAAMKAFRGAPAHRQAMLRLAGWCDEASVAHWEQPAADLPATAEALQRMQTAGRLLRVTYPSADHAAGRVAADNHPPARGNPLRPGMTPE